MTKIKNTKRALVASILTLCLCFTSLLGTTFAWFTDSVTSSNNIIKSGNLDILLEYWDGDSWEDVKDRSDILAGELWEPGYTDVAYLRLKNNGSLALKYALGVNIVSEKEGVNKDGDPFKLSDYIYFDVAEGVNGQTAAYETREDAMAIATETKKISEGHTQFGTLEKGSDFVYLAIVVYMPTSVGNVANHNGVDVPQIDLGINVFATQATVESDSFNNQYDADTAVFNVDDANAMLAENKDVTLVNCVDPDAILWVPAGYTGTLTLHNVTIASVMEGAAPDTASLSAEEDDDETIGTKIVIQGNVVIKATEDGMSAITGTDLDISGNGNLTAIGKGEAAFGIGGMTTESISIKDITINYVEGGYAYGVGTDTKYYKDAPEGGAAIGSGFDGAVINLDNVNIVRAIGGSKSAAIGAYYHIGVTVNISNSTIRYAEGGVSAAAIGSSRVSNGATEQGTTINITNSVVTAQGGAYGAGIGSGYDTHCQSSQPLCTINISDSTINATGGKYAAGVGTGYHNAALEGEIKDSTVTAKSGEKFYKDTYTQAQDIGFGVVDPTRDGQQTDSKLIYNGTEITIPEVVTITAWEALDVVSGDVSRENMVAEEYVEIAHNSGNLTIKNCTFKNGLTFYTTNTTNNGTITLEDCTIYLSDGTPANNSYKMCKADYGVYLDLANGSTMEVKFVNCTFTKSADHTYAANQGYNIYITGDTSAKSISFEGCTFEGTAKHGIGCSAAKAPYYALKVTGCNFKDWNNNATNGAAIRGNLPSADFNANITISGNTFTNSNNSTQNTVAIDHWTGTWN